MMVYHLVTADKAFIIYLHNDRFQKSESRRFPSAFSAAVTPLIFPALHMARGIFCAKISPAKRRGIELLNQEDYISASASLISSIAA